MQRTFLFGVEFLPLLVAAAYKDNVLIMLLLVVVVQSRVYRDLGKMREEHLYVLDLGGHVLMTHPTAHPTWGGN